VEGIEVIAAGVKISQAAEAASIADTKKPINAKNVYRLFYADQIKNCYNAN
jgi:ribosomal protein L24